MLLSPSKIQKLMAKGLPCQPGDGNGLSLDIRSKTSASWVFKWTDVTGKACQMGIGSLAKLDLEAARERRDWLNGVVAAHGCPRDALRATKHEAARVKKARTSLPIGELAREYVDLIAPKITTAQARDTWVNSLQEDSIGALAKKYPHEVTREDCRQMLETRYAKVPEADRKWRGKSGGVVVGNRIRQRLAALLGWANEKGMIQVTGWSNPCKWTDVDQEFNRKAHVEKHHAAVKPTGIGAVMAKIRDRQSAQVPALALEWIVISAVRMEEGCGAKWDEIDFENDCWNVPVERLKVKRRAKGKMSPTHRVPLTARHHEILELLAPPEGSEKVHIFTCYSRDVPVSTAGVRRVINAVRDDKGHFTGHGMRATFKTWAKTQVVDVKHPLTNTPIKLPIYDPEWVEAALAHIKGDPYDRNEYLEERRALMEGWAAYVGVVQEQKVVSLDRRRLRRAA